MPAVFDKLNLKNQKQIVVLNAPQSFERELGTLRDVAVIRDAHPVKKIAFSLAFVTTMAGSRSAKPGSNPCAW